MSRFLSRWQAVALGTVVFAGLVLAGVGLFTVGSRNWLGSGAFEVQAGFQDVGGIEEGTRVRIQGMDAGEVAAVELPASAGGSVILRLRLAGRFRNLIGDPATAGVQIGTDGVWGGKYVKILPGRPGGAPLTEPVILTARPTPELTEELSQAAGKLKVVLGDLEETMRNVRQGRGTLGQLVQNEELYREVNEATREAREAFAEVKGALREIRQGQGTLGLLVKSKDVYAESMRTIEQVREMVASVKQNADALKSMPIVRSYVIDPNKLLNRPDCTFERRWFPEDKLFEPGRAVLTAEGRKQLSQVAEWLNRHKEKGSEVVVAAYAAPGMRFEAAQTLTQKQSEAVCTYLTSEYKVHKTGWWWWQSRNVNPVGCGTQDSPIPADANVKLPAPRVEIIVFTPE